MYAEKQQLADLVREFQRTGNMPQELYVILDKVITGVAFRYRYAQDMEDRRQEYFLLVLKKFRNIDPDGRVFGYLTRCALNCLFGQHRAKERYGQLLRNLERDSSPRRERL